MNRLKLIAVLLLPTLCFGATPIEFSPFMASTAKPFFLTDWPARVVAHGGALPSANSTNSVNIFYTHLVLTGLTNKLISVIGLCPESLIAATVPIYFQDGYSMWTNVNFDITNLTVNGLTGNLTNKSLLTGLFPSTMSAGGFTDISAGISILIYSATNTSSAGNLEFGASGTAANSLWALQHSSVGIAYYSWLAASVSAGFVIRQLPPPGTNWSGYISGNRTAADAIRIDLVTNGVMGVWTNGIGTVGGNNNNSITNSRGFANYVPLSLGPGSWSDRTVSFIAIHGGLTFTESSNLYQGVLMLRTNFGGGVPQAQ